MIITPAHRQLLQQHLEGPQPHIARCSRKTRLLLSHGLLSFNPRKTMTRITKRGRRRLGYEMLVTRLAAGTIVLPSNEELRP